MGAGQPDPADSYRRCHFVIRTLVAELTTGLQTLWEDSLRQRAKIASVPPCRPSTDCLSRTARLGSADRIFKIRSQSAPNRVAKTDIRDSGPGGQTAKQGADLLFHMG